MQARLHVCQSESDGDKQAQSGVLEVAYFEMFRQIFTTSTQFSEQMLQTALGGMCTCRAIQLQRVSSLDSSIAKEAQWSQVVKPFGGASKCRSSSGYR